MDIEKLATSAIIDAMARTDVIDSFVNSGDKEPSWDGNLYVYSEASKRKNNLIGKVPVQVKGQSCKKFAQNEFKFSIEITDLKNYLIDGGILYFVVQVLESADKKIFYRILSVNDIEEILDSAKGVNTVSVNMYAFPKENNEVIKVVTELLKERNRSRLNEEDIVLGKKNTENLKINKITQRKSFGRRQNEYGSYLKNSCSYNSSLARVDDLIEDVKDLSAMRERDENLIDDALYRKLLLELLNNYLGKKSREIEDVVTLNKNVKNQRAFRYNEGQEYSLFYELLEGAYANLNLRMEESAPLIIWDIIELNVKRAKHANEQELFVQNTIKISQVEHLVKTLYRCSGVFGKSIVIRKLHKGCGQGKDEYERLCMKCLVEYITVEVREASEERRCFNHDIFQNVFLSEKFNDILAEKVIEYMIGWKREVHVSIIELLNVENSQYVFSFLVIYYSIYRFRFEWENIQIKALALLWEKSKEFSVDGEKIIYRIGKTNIAHRQYKEAYYELERCLRNTFTELELEYVEKQRYIDLFYVVVMKVCIIHQRFYALTDISTEIQIKIIMDLSKHEELLMDTHMRKFISYIQINNSYNSESVPREFLFSIRQLLLSNIEISTLFSGENDCTYKYSTAVGEYLLIKYEGKQNMTNEMREQIWSAYINHNCSVEEYLGYLENECEICNFHLDYVQRERIKKYLKDEMKKIMSK